LSPAQLSCPSDKEKLWWSMHAGSPIRRQPLSLNGHSEVASARDLKCSEYDGSPPGTIPLSLISS
jgi:hypothetical protein